MLNFSQPGNNQKVITPNLSLWREVKASSTETVLPLLMSHWDLKTNRISAEQHSNRSNNTGEAVSLVPYWKQLTFRDKAAPPLPLLFKYNPC